MSLTEIMTGFKHERWAAEGLVGDLKRTLDDEEGITIDEKGGNRFHAKKGEREVVISAHESSPEKPGLERKGWWDVSCGFEVKAKASGLPWGVVLLHPIKCGFWLDAEAFETLKGKLDTQEGYNFQLKHLESVPWIAKRFTDAKHFLLLSGLGDG